MGQERLSSLALINIEKEIAIDADKVVDDFAKINVFTKVATKLRIASHVLRSVYKYSYRYITSTSYMYACMHVRMYVCMFVCIYIYTCIVYTEVSCVFMTK